MNEFTFNINQVEDNDQGSFSPLPEGEYLAQIIESDVKTTKAGNGRYISLKYEVMDGSFKGPTALG